MIGPVRLWWQTTGAPLYPDATRLLVTAGAGGSNGSRLRLWKMEIQKLADEAGLEIAVRHFPPGTSKWNKIEHRLFSAITQNWRASRSSATRSSSSSWRRRPPGRACGVRSELDRNPYPAGRTISDADMETLYPRPDAFHGQWNYALLPRLMQAQGPALQS